MTAENQRKILEATSRLFKAVSSAMDGEPCSYEEGIRFIREYGNRTLFDLLLVIIKRLLPVVGQEQTLTPESIPHFLDAMDTRQKAEDLLASFPDPNPRNLEKVLREVDLFLPSVRQILVPFAKQLPPPPGGPPRKIPLEEEPRVREEVARYFKDGYSLPKAKEKVARNRGTSVSTIQRILKKGTSEND
ncbi:hypothetical protein [Tunturiibacter lichenicola]|uniref:hypothetical protein n=1 Tax=Tunturiibacter lichenicola TaxID=2051959 RepID=UPI003D9B9EF5